MAKDYLYRVEFSSNGYMRFIDEKHMEPVNPHMVIYRLASRRLYIKRTGRNEFLVFERKDIPTEEELKAVANIEKSY